MTSVCHSKIDGLKPFFGSLVAIVMIFNYVGRQKYCIEVQQLFMTIEFENLILSIEDLFVNVYFHDSVLGIMICKHQKSLT